MFVMTPWTETATKTRGGVITALVQQGSGLYEQSRMDENEPRQKNEITFSPETPERDEEGGHIFSEFPLSAKEKMK